MPLKDKFSLGILIFFLIIVFACSIQQVKKQPASKIPASNIKENAAESILTPILNIVSPKDNALIKNTTLNVEVQAENFKLAPVGSPVKEGEGHFHVWLDNEKKLGPQTTFTFENVVTGKHTIVAELVQSDHFSLTPKIAKSITINIDSGIDEKQKQVNNQADVSEFTVEADDKGFYPNTLQAKIGDKVKINFKFRDDSIYFAGLDVKGPFPTLKYKLKSAQPLTTEFTMNQETKIDSYWPSSGVHKATLTVEVAK